MFTVKTSMTDPNDRPVVSATVHHRAEDVATWVQVLLDNGATGVLTIEQAEFGNGTCDTCGTTCTKVTPVGDRYTCEWCV